VSDGYKNRTISVKRNMKIIKANVIVSECIVRYRVVAYKIPRDYSDILFRG